MLKPRWFLLAFTLLIPIVGTAQQNVTGEPGGVDAIARDAQTAISREDWSAAIRGYEKLIKLAPARADFQLNLGVARYFSGKAKDAVPAFRQALKLKPDLLAAQDYLSVSLAESGQCREALPRLKKAGRGSDAQLKRAVGLAGVRCSMSAGQPEEAIDFIRRLTRDFPHDPEVLYLSAHVYSDLSIRASQELLFKAPSSYQVRLLNAEALETQGRWDDAASEYRQVLAKNPNLPGIHYRL